jgi:glycosyltransferase involved in cell wall biosynthesis
MVVMLTPHGDPLGSMGEPDIGGQCMYIRELSKHLSDKGISVRAFTRDRGDGKPKEEIFSKHASVIRISCGPSGFIPKEQILPYLDEFADGVAEHLTGGETLHSHYWDGGYVASKIRSQQPWFHSTHSLGKIKQRSLPGDAKYQYGDRIRIEEEVYRGCDRVFALTDIERDQIHALYGVSSDRIGVIPPGVDIDVFRPGKSKAGSREKLHLPDTLTVSTLGRLDSRKGLDLFLRAAGALRDRHEFPSLSVVLSAGDGSPGEAEERDKLNRIIEKLQLQAVLTWLPVLPEAQVPDFYQASDVFVLPSRYEPFGIVMLEAMATGVPVVATTNGGPSKVIEHGRDGYLVDPESSDRLAGLIADLLIDTDRRVAFGQNARAKVEAEYSWTSIAERFRTAYGFAGEGGSDAR